MIRPIAEMSNCGSQVTNPLPFHKSRGWGVVGHREFNQTCNSRLFTLLLLREEGVCASSHMWRPEDSIWKLVLSSYRGDQALNSGCHAYTAGLHLLSQLSAPDTQLLMMLWDRTKKIVFPKTEEKQTLLWQNWTREGIPTACSVLTLCYTSPV